VLANIFVIEKEDEPVHNQLPADLISTIMEALKVNLQDAKASAVRTNALKALGLLFARVKGTHLLDPFVQQLTDQLNQVTASFPNKHYEVDNLLVTLKNINEK